MGDFALCNSLLVDGKLSSIVEVLVFLATSFVDACVMVRCFIKLELLTTDVDSLPWTQCTHHMQVFAFDHNEYEVVLIFPS